jgi:hypothetical protein
MIPNAYAFDSGMSFASIAAAGHRWQFSNASLNFQQETSIDPPRTGITGIKDISFLSFTPVSLKRQRTGEWEIQNVVKFSDAEPGVISSI